jgi:hypothetical protein
LEAAAFGVGDVDVALAVQGDRGRVLSWYPNRGDQAGSGLRQEAEMTTPTDPAAGDRVLRALIASRALEVDGQYNAAKLFRAAALGQAIRATREHPGEGTEREHLMRGVIADLRAARGDDALVAAMERALTAIRGGEAWVTLEDAPRTMVCRGCGEVLLGEPPAACPTCGSRPLGFQEILAIYYLEPLDVGPLLAVLAETPAEVERLCAGAGEEQARRGVWPAREIVLHLMAAEDMLTGRAWRMLEEDEPALVSVPPPTADPAAQQQPFSALVARFRATREETLSRLRLLTPAHWERSGFHPEWGRITVRQQLSYVARHEQSHLAELEAMCRAA